MQTKYVYKHKGTGQKIYTDFPQNNKDLELVRELKNTKMGKGSNIRKKAACPKCDKEFKNLGAHMKKHG